MEEQEPNWGGRTWPPLAQLALRMRVTKYRPNREEIQMLMRCRHETVVGCAKSAFFAGIVGWTVTARLKFLARAIVTAGVSFVGVEIGRQFAETKCMKYFLSLQGSPLQGELMAILQRDFPEHPVLRQILQSQKEANQQRISDAGEDIPFRRLPLPGPDGRLHGDISGGATIQDEWEATIEAKRDRQPSDPWEELGHLLKGDKASGQQGNARRAARGPVGDSRWDVSEGKDKNESHEDTDMLVNPFDLSVWSQDAQDNTDGGPERAEVGGKERRRSRMTAKERHEHNRRQYVQREDQQQQGD